MNFEQSVSPLPKQASVTVFPLFKYPTATPNLRCFMYSEGGIPKKRQKLRSNVLIDVLETLASSRTEIECDILSCMYRIASDNSGLSLFS